MKKLVKKIFNFLGYEIKRINKSHEEGFYSSLNTFNAVDLDKLAVYNSFIDGMITDQQGKIIFILCYFQNIKGDILEIGSFKGKSTSYLYRAFKESSNGNLIVIDNFKGNYGKEKFYGDDFKNSFINNMRKIGNDNEIKIIDSDSFKGLDKVKNNSVRFIYIDGDHSFDAIKKDLLQSINKLKKGGIIVLDDYFSGFPDLIKSVNLIIKDLEEVRLVTFSHNLVIQLYPN